MTPQADGRTYACTFCRTQVQVAVEGHQIAAGMRLDLANVDAFLAQLAHTLHTASRRAHEFRPTRARSTPSR